MGQPVPPSSLRLPSAWLRAAPFGTVSEGPRSTCVSELCVARSAGSGKSAASRANRAVSRPPESPKVPRALCLTVCPQAPTPTTAGWPRPQLCRFQNVTQLESDVHLLMYREHLSTSKNIHLSDGFKRIHSFFLSEYISTCSNNIREFPLFFLFQIRRWWRSHTPICARRFTWIKPYEWKLGGGGAPPTL